VNKPTKADWQAFDAARDEWTALAYCRQGLDIDEIKALLAAITGKMGINDSVCIALDKCAEELDIIATTQVEAALWEADARACRQNRMVAR